VFILLAVRDEPWQFQLLEQSHDFRPNGTLFSQVAREVIQHTPQFVGLFHRVVQCLEDAVRSVQRSRVEFKQLLKFATVDARANLQFDRESLERLVKLLLDAFRFLVDSESQTNWVAGKRGLKLV